MSRRKKIVIIILILIVFLCVSGWVCIMWQETDRSDFEIELLPEEDAKEGEEKADEKNAEKDSGVNQHYADDIEKNKKGQTGNSVREADDSDGENQNGEASENGTVTSREDMELPFVPAK